MLIEPAKKTTNRRAIDETISGNIRARI